MKSFASFIILFRYRVYKKCVEVFKKSLRFGDFFAAQNDNSAQNQRDAEDALNRQRLVENERSDDRADDPGSTEARMPARLDSMPSSPFV